MKGRVIYSSGGNYKVQVGKEIFTAKPKGLFRKTSKKVIVGDIVDIKLDNNKDYINVIQNIHPRINEFLRPNIANLDFIIIVTSITLPKLNDYILDKLITIFQIQKIEPILIFTKSDIEYDKNHKKIIDEYIMAGYKVLTFGNMLTPEDLNLFKKWTKNKFSALTGQTGVGKTTFLNYISGLNLKTQEISKVLNRGKTTTTINQIFNVFDEVSLIADTPGFSSLEISINDLKLIPSNFFNFETIFSKCKFNDCTHTHEKECYVKSISSKRSLNNYFKLLEEYKTK